LLRRGWSTGSKRVLSYREITFPACTASSYCEHERRSLIDCTMSPIVGARLLAEISFACERDAHCSAPPCRVSPLPETWCDFIVRPRWIAVNLVRASSICGLDERQLKNCSCVNRVSSAHRAGENANLSGESPERKIAGVVPIKNPMMRSGRYPRRAMMQSGLVDVVRGL